MKNDVGNLIKKQMAVKPFVFLWGVRRVVEKDIPLPGFKHSDISPHFSQKTR